MRYPRTYHLPDSPGATRDDLVQHDLTWLDGELVVTEKLDGGNLTFTRDAVYGRSPGAETPPWDRPAKALWAMTSYRIPDDWRVCGESMWARRSIAYSDLPGVFIVFGIWDETDTLLGWDDTVDWATRLELPVVPVLYRGGSLSEARAAWAARRDAENSEGFVVRSAGRIPAGEFPLRVLKWVRAGHVRVPAARTEKDEFAVNEFA
ncbi:RNA ligase family protein [Paractinoplanes brasiliensis]|uniref:RNA ligase n=1 Tax=Paractinoplanes brasiliensis TaxID=52695 RepID=A0A4R6JX88_9ACTN|nr:RNA ligase family protein [Actinoplanes brasiliensis]TDO40492.1 RNA ligase [Actinoplanes brasiliensis]GID25561.1 2'-5' RNA ligase [Actinoplanes brasiliensis]